MLHFAASVFKYSIATNGVKMKSVFMFTAIKFGLILFLLLQSKALADVKKSLIVGTYAYGEIDRYEAVLPLANLVNSVSGKPTSIKVFSSPSELADAFISLQIHVAVPNLASFANIAALTDKYLLLFAPDALGSTYTSSVATQASNCAATKIDNSADYRIGMVWQDSTSGAILGSAFLSDELKLNFQKEDVAYLGSHEAVLKAIQQGEIDLGVLATKVLLQVQDKQKLKEIWRSAVIPFGPVICSEKIKKICSDVSEVVFENAKVSANILTGLKNGWVEFDNSQNLIQPEPEIYTQFIKHWKTKTLVD